MGTDPGSEPQPSSPVSARGPLAWLARHSVAANVLMVVLVAGGLTMLLSGRIEQEVFPTVDLDIVVVTVPYPGASPEEVEQGVVLAVEEAVRGLDGVKEVRATAAEGRAVVAVELLLGTDADRALSDVKSAVDRIASLPDDAERPVVSLATSQQHVISLVLHGDRSERELRDLGEQVRTALLQDERVTQVELSGIRPPEISIEIPQRELRKHHLTLPAVASVVGEASVDMPAGTVDTEGGELLVRTAERRDRGEQLERVELLSRPDGSSVRIGDIAHVVDGYRDVDIEAHFQGRRAVLVNVYRVGDETPLSVSAAAKELVERERSELPDGVDIAVWADRSQMYRDRIQLLLRNGYIGLLLVLLTLGLFLEVRLAFWVTLGIPISFLGGLLVMPWADASINMISLFAFIVTLGMVVDDAIVVGEAIYKHRTEGMSRLQSAVCGVREVARPVTFAVITTCVAFAPMLFVPGVMGKFFRVIPIVVIAVFLASLIESLGILPAHLAHTGEPATRGIRGWLHGRQQAFRRLLERFVEHRYRPFLERCLRWRYLTAALGIALLLACAGIVAGERIGFTFMPRVEGEVVTASLRMPVGTPVERTRAARDHMAEAAAAILRRKCGEADCARGILTELGRDGSFYSSPLEGVREQGGHLARVMVYLAPADQRDFGAGELARQWRQAITVPGAELLSFDYDVGASGGAPIDIELTHEDEQTLRHAASRLAGALEPYRGVEEIDDGYRRGKQQLDFELRDAGHAYGLTAASLAQQLRGAFYGAEAKRLQRGRDELRIYVRLPKHERSSLHTVERLVLRTPAGQEIRLGRAARVTRDRADIEITRTDGRRTVNVTADVVPGVANANRVVADLEKSALPELLASTPGLSYSMGGEQEEQASAMSSLYAGFGLAMLVIFAMLAVAFRSYLQPLIVMSAIPFGTVGALTGHILMGYEISLVSMMGVVALAGVVVNDSLILVMAVNEYREGLPSPFDACVEGGVRRYRPIVLTSLTTFFGLMPMILETSIQARFLVPMAISLGFGVLFATLITLVLVPAFYMIVDDVRQGGRRLLATAGLISLKHPSASC